MIDTLAQQRRYSSGGKGLIVDGQAKPTRGFKRRAEECARVWKLVVEDSLFCCGSRRRSRRRVSFVEFTQKHKPSLQTVADLFSCHCRSCTQVRHLHGFPRSNRERAEEDKERDATDRWYVVVGSSNSSGSPTQDLRVPCTTTLRRLAQTGALPSAYYYHLRAVLRRYASMILKGFSPSQSLLSCLVERRGTVL